VQYLDIGPKFLDADGELPKDVMPDKLHPTAKGYQIWYDAMWPTLEPLLK
jgi:lysophospholipase L1-like esterase